MKKYLFLLLILLSTHSHAQDSHGGAWVEMQVKIVDPTEANPTVKRAPIPIQMVYYDGSSFLLSRMYEGCVFKLLKNKEEIFSCYVFSCGLPIEIPFYLTGEYEIQLVRGNLCFYGFLFL